MQMWVTLCNWLLPQNCKFHTSLNESEMLISYIFSLHRHSRDWRYHVEEKVWITRVPGIQHYEKNGSQERGTFYYFDAQNWRRVPKEFQLDASKLDKCPNLSVMSLSGQPV